MPHKRDQVFYDGESVVMSRLNWPSEKLASEVTGKVEARHVHDSNLKHLDDEVDLREGDTVNSLVRDVINEKELSLSLLNSRL